MSKIELNHSNSIPLSLNELVVRGHGLRLTKRMRMIYLTGVMGQTKKRLPNLLSVATWGYFTGSTVITLWWKLWGGAQLETIRDASASLCQPLPAVVKFNGSWLNKGYGSWLKKGWQHFCFMDGSASVAFRALLPEIKILSLPTMFVGVFSVGSQSFLQSIN